MGGFSLILLIVGSLATDATRHQIYTGFRSRLGGRIATGFVSFSILIYSNNMNHTLVFDDCLRFVTHVVIYSYNLGYTLYESIYS